MEYIRTTQVKGELGDKTTNVYIKIRKHTTSCLLFSLWTVSFFLDIYPGPLEAAFRAKAAILLCISVLLVFACCVLIWYPIVLPNMSKPLLLEHGVPTHFSNSRFWHKHRFINCHQVWFSVFVVSAWFANVAWFAMFLQHKYHWPKLQPTHELPTRGPKICLLC